MKKITAPFVALALIAVGPTAFGLYSVSNTGTWPKDWPRELETLRAQSRTLVGPTLAARHFAMRFANRDEFEAAWPHILKVKSKEAPIYLVRGPNFFLGKKQTGVVVHCPPEGQWENPKTPEAPIDGYPNESRSRWRQMNYLELLVDGQIVDLNRIPLPPDTLIIDERFKEDEQSTATDSR